MTKSLRLTIAFSTCLLAAPASAAVVVLGSSPAYSCYTAARARDGSLQALRWCDEAFASGMLTRKDEVATYVNRGVIKLLGRKYDAAIEDFDRAIAMDPSEPESYLNKGSALLRKKASAAEAIDLFNAALERNTSRPDIAYFARAAAHEETGNVRAAYRDYLRAQQAAPNWSLPKRELMRFQVRRASGSSL